MKRHISILSLIFLPLLLSAQINGSYVVPGNFASLAEVINIINTNGINGDLTIQVIASETAPAGGFVLKNYNGNQLASLTIKAVGDVTLGAPTGTTDKLDGIFTIVGADNVTIEGFTLLEDSLNTNTISQMEWGIGVLPENANDAVQNLSIKKCHISFHPNTNPENIGIYIAHHSPDSLSIIEPQSEDGSFKNIKIFNNTIENTTKAGILANCANTFNYLDSDFEIGNLNFGNNILSFGGNSYDTYGIYVKGVKNLKIHKNQLDNKNKLKQTGNTFGIYAQGNNPYNVDIQQNTFKMGIDSTEKSLNCIYTNGTFRVINIKENIITQCKIIGNSSFFGIKNEAIAQKIIFDANQILDNNVETSGDCFLICNQPLQPFFLGADSTFCINNKFKNWERSIATKGNTYGYFSNETRLNNTFFPNRIEVISHNEFDNFKGSSLASFIGKFNLIYAVSMNESSYYNNQKHRIVSNNTIKNIRDTRVNIEAITCLFQQKITIEKNSILNLNCGGSIIGITTQHCENLISSQNTIQQLSASAQISALNYNALKIVAQKDSIKNLITQNFPNVSRINAVRASADQIEISDYQINTLSSSVVYGITINNTKYNSKCYNNKIENIIHLSSTSVLDLYGIYIANCNNLDICKNSINNLISNTKGTSSIYGIAALNTDSTNIYKNHINNLKHNVGFTANVSGFCIINKGNLNFYNNIIENISAGASTNISGLNGIQVLGVTPSEAYFYNNTIKINDNPLNTGVSGILINANGSVNCSNNIFDLAVSTAYDKNIAVIRNIKTASRNAFYHNQSNNNLFSLPYADNSYYFYQDSIGSITAFSPYPFPQSGVYDANFNNYCSSYKAYRAGGDSQSFSEKINWQGNMPSGKSHCENGGKVISLVSDDFAGTPRGSQIDIGALQFSGIPENKNNSCLSLKARVLLSYSGIAMNDYVRQLATFPLIDPYSKHPFNTKFIHLNNQSDSLDAKVLLNNSSDAIVDWVFLELRQGNTGATYVVYTKAGLLQKDGDIVAIDGVSPIQFEGINGSYFITIRHRNHLGFRTASAYPMSHQHTSLDFTNNLIPIAGSVPFIQIGGTYTMIGGDANFDGSIDAFDTIIWELENGLFDDYQYNADYNLDGSIDAFDSIFWEINNGKFEELD